MRQEIKEAKQSGNSDDMLAALLSDEEAGLMPLIRELAGLAEPQVTILLSMAEQIADYLGVIGNGDIRHLVDKAHDHGRDLRDLILVQHGRR